MPQPCPIAATTARISVGSGTMNRCAAVPTQPTPTQAAATVAQVPRRTSRSRDRIRSESPSSTYHPATHQPG
ncbi:MAG: hypothetical protein ACKO6B_06750, partial [Planctomycetia bacterium]